MSESTRQAPGPSLPPPDERLRDQGAAMYDLVRELYPLNRSITGNGVRETLRILQRHVPLELHEVATGTPVFDWEVPREWNIRGAYVEDGAGQRVVDFAEHNLHVVGYSVPVDATMQLAELRPHLHSLPDKPGWIPYRTSYYDENWGFCLAHDVLESLRDGEYRVVIDSSLVPGSLTYGELLLPGDSADEVLVFAHVCHPSLCNDNLSGISVATFLAKELARRPRHYSYRFVFAPATIGSITWMAENTPVLERVAAGLVLSVIGDDGPFVYKESRRGNTPVDRAARHVLGSAYPGSRVEAFSPWGYDERQFCSPGVNLPVGRLTRTPHGEYPQYHTSADDLTVVDAGSLGDSLAATSRILYVLENDVCYTNLEPRGEPQLGRRGLYRKLGGYQDVADRQLAMLWVLNQSDGRHSLLDIAERAQLPFELVRDAADDLVAAKLLALASGQAGPPREE